MNTPAVKKTNQVDKLLVVGHPLSDSELVLDLMEKCNISQAHQLKKEGIKAHDISNILLKAYGINHIDEATEQIEVSPVWNGLAMDLMMSNIEHSRWLWADSNALPLLNYWKSLDKNLAFVLVYNSPQKVVEKLLDKAELSLASDIKQVFEQWHSYNRMLLNFYYRNQDRAILVNSQQVQNNSIQYLQEVGKQIGLKNDEISNSLVEIEIQEDDYPSQDSLYMYLAQQLVDANEQTKLLYLELESVSNLPLINDKYTKNPSVYEVLRSYIHEQEYTRILSQQLENEKEKHAETFKEQEYLKSKLEKERQKSEVLHIENEQGLSQLMHVQEELEKIHSDMNTVQEKLTKTKELEAENKLLLEQLHLVQEELEKFYLQNIELKKKNSTSNTKQEKRYYGAAERIKQQLSYRLGTLMIEKSKSLGGVLGLPFAIYSEVRKFRVEKASRNEKLPPLHSYMDAYDADRIKKHLSYRLGQAMIQSMKSPLGIFKLPFALTKAHTEYKKGRKNV